MPEATIAAVAGGLIGAFFGGGFKFLWETWLPQRYTWRRQRVVERERQLASVRAPAVSALTDMRERLYAIASTQAKNYVYVRSVGQGDYYVDSTAYVVARALAWQEVLRQRMSTSDYADLYQRLEAVTGALSHGGPGFQVWRLEQREIGERMAVDSLGDAPGCMAFSDFLDSGRSEAPPKWLQTLRARVTALLDNPVRELDRVEVIDHAVLELRDFLDPSGRWCLPEAPPPLKANAIRQGLKRQQPVEGRDP